MGIYKQARKLALGVACASGLVAGVGMVAAPGSALAVPCAATTTGSGSSLQEAQQNEWKILLETTQELANCTPKQPKFVYTATSSGQGLKEFGMPGKKLVKTESGNKSTLDAFIGTDDPPTAGQLTEAKEASESNAVVVPVVAAPVAIIVHLPKECLLKNEVGVTNAALSKAFASEAITWEEFLGAANVESKDVSKVACKSKPMIDVRFDESGTSFALKQYLCQVNKTVWGGGAASKCESGEGFVSDNNKWPNEKEFEAAKEKATEIPLHWHEGVKNEKSKGEVEAIEKEEGSLGYANLANATGKFVLSATDSELFWVNVEGKENETGTLFYDPLASTTVVEANCPKSFSFAGTQETEAKESKWATIHLASPAISGAYPLCTLTYDVGWENYLTTKLKGTEGYGSELVAEENGGSAQNYFEYMVKATVQQMIATDYSKLPSTIQTVAGTLAALLKP